MVNVLWLQELFQINTRKLLIICSLAMFKLNLLLALNWYKCFGCLFIVCILLKCFQKNISHFYLISLYLLYFFHLLFLYYYRLELHFRILHIIIIICCCLNFCFVVSFSYIFNKLWCFWNNFFIIIFKGN